MHNHQIVTARKLFHRALRLMPDNNQLYIEFCRLEILYAESMKKLQEPEFDSVDITNVEDKANEEEKAKGSATLEQFISIIEDADTTSKKDSAVDPILRYEIPRIIYRHAIEKKPNDLHIRKQFLWLFEEFKETISLQQLVHDDIQKEISDDPEALIFCMVFPYRNQIIPDSCLEQLQQTLMKNYSPSLFTQILYLCSDRLERDPLVRENLSLYIENLWENVSKVKIRSDYPLSENILFMFAQLFMKTEKPETALAVLKTATELFPDKSETWYQYAYALSLLETDKNKITQLFKTALSRKSVSLALVELFFEHCLSENLTELIFDQYKKILESRSYPKEELQQFTESVLDILLSKGEEQLIRKIYNYTLEYFPANSSYYLKCANYECSAFITQDKLNIRKIFRDAINRYGKTEPGN